MEIDLNPMEKEGPLLDSLTRRLVDIPPDFLDEPKIDSPVGATGEVFVPALVFDLLKGWSIKVPVETLDLFRGKDLKTDRNRLALAMIAVWLLADDWFKSQTPGLEKFMEVLHGAVGELAKTKPSQDYVRDPDRREELARVSLARLGYRPAGETLHQATDRLSAVSGTERKRLIDAARLAEKRAREIREALIRKAAEESADKYTRE